MSIEQILRETVRKVLREELPGAMQDIIEASNRNRDKYIPTAEVLKTLHVSRSWWAAALKENPKIRRYARKNGKQHYFPVGLIEEIRLAGNDLAEGERRFTSKNNNR